MIKLTKILVEALLGLVVLFLLGTMYAPNLVIILCIGVFIWVLETEKLNRQRKINISMMLLVIIGIYLALPKKITGCGVLSTGTVCSTDICQGLPMLALTTPQCLGRTSKTLDSKN